MPKRSAAFYHAFPVAAPRWTTQQVLALAPDKRSGTAARGLADPRTWSQLGSTGLIVFGRCQGSGSAPYQVVVELAEPTFICTCPSRKVPCKHGLALLLLWAEHGERLGRPEAVEPRAHRAAEAAVDRATGRRRRGRTRAGDGPGAYAEVVADPEARARRQAQRESAMTAGMDELEQWLADLVRQGVAEARRRPYDFWDSMAARLVDAQMPALADRVRVAGGALSGREDWADVLVAECGRWQLAVHAWRRRDALGPATLADLRTFLGWPRRAGEVAGFERAPDHWVVAGVRQGQDGRVASQRTWLWGRRSGRWVVLLDFAAAGAALRVAQVVGSVIDDALLVYPGSEPPRAALSGAERVVAHDQLPEALEVASAVDRLAGWLAANPWRDRLPVALAGVVPVEDRRARWWLRDQAGDRLPLAPAVEPWPLLALSGGAPVTVTAEWDGGNLYPMTVSPAGDREPVAL